MGRSRKGGGTGGILSSDNFLPRLKGLKLFLGATLNTHIFWRQGGGEGGGKDGDFMSEAKDWAGELISGQTGTGRILVSKLGINQWKYGTINRMLTRSTLVFLVTLGIKPLTLALILAGKNVSKYRYYKYIDLSMTSPDWPCDWLTSTGSSFFIIFFIHLNIWQGRIKGYSSMQYLWHYDLTCYD